MSYSPATLASRLALVLACFCAPFAAYAQAVGFIDAELAIGLTVVDESALAQRYLVQDSDTIYFDQVSSLARPGKLSGTTANGEAATVYVTDLPVFAISLPQEIIDEPKRFASMEVLEPGRIPRTFDIAIELRGASSLKLAKKTYDLELRVAEGSDESVNASFGGLRSDDDWILDGLSNEPLRIRSVMAHQLWVDTQVPSYISEGPTAQSGARAIHCEVFLNGSYQGIYALSEQVDRKQLQVKKPDDSGQVRGSILRSIDFTDLTNFRRYTPPPNDDILYEGYKWSYPKTQPDWWSFVPVIQDGVAPAGPGYVDEFLSNFYPNNFVDYYLFVQLGAFKDNINKNVYFCRYDRDEPLFVVPWDLDAGFGNTWDGQVDTVTHALHSRNLTRRLYEEEDVFYRLCQQRYNSLRAGPWARSNIEARFDSLYTSLTSNLAYEREALLYPEVLGVGNSYNFLKEWTALHYQFLDKYFDYTSTAGTSILREEAKLLLYPNPVTDEVTIVLPEEVQLPQEVLIRDSNGSVVYAGTVSSRVFSLDVELLGKGMYVVVCGEYGGVFVVL